MTNKQKPTWLAITELPKVSQVVALLLQDTKEMYPLFAQAKEQPWVMDDATIERTIKLYTERLDILAEHDEQLARWKKGTLTPVQQQEITRLANQTAQTRDITTQILALADEIKRNTIDQILARDDAELALDVLTGKLKLPK